MPSSNLLRAPFYAAVALGCFGTSIPVRTAIAIPRAAAVAIPPAASASQIPGVSDLCADPPAARGLERVSARASAPAAEPSRRGSLLGRPASDLYCLDLLPTAAGRGAVGVVELGRVPSPFGVTVTADGHHVFDLTAWIEGLPPPESIGQYTTFVAWATTQYLEPTIKLGEVRNGRNELGRISFNKFLVLITAEESLAVEERRGRLVLRGRSPSTLMEGHDLLAQAPEALAAPRGSASTMMELAVGGDAWATPPMYPDVPVLPGMMALTPEVNPVRLGVESIADLPEARPSQLVHLGDGGTLDLEAKLVRRELEGQTLVMLGFNGQQPGPMIRVPEKSTIFVNFANNTPFATSVHWHGVRLDNRFDGVPDVTQDPVEPGESFRYQIYFRDAGIYWYHPHHREDIQQELGLYGNLLVDSRKDDYFGPVNREDVVMLDDLLLDENAVVSFGEESANYMLMGRFGNLFLVNGEPKYELEVRRGEIVRFFFTNVSNTRTFNVSFRRPPSESARESDEEPASEDPGAQASAGSPAKPTGPPLQIKVVGSDIGKFEREQWAESVVISPAERYIVEVRFDEPGEIELVNHVQAINHRYGTFVPESSLLGTIRVADERAEHDHRDAFETLRENADVIADIDEYRNEFHREVDHELVLTLEVDDLPRITEQVMLYDWIYFNPVEWGGTMPMMNWATTGNEVRWILRDPETAAENMDIDWRFKVGDAVKIRLYNDRDAFHAMQHPVHIHGQRFLVLQQNGVPNDNLVWKDTVLLPTGSTTDILLELSNPGRWMVHCHIAEHLESGMKFVLEVEEP